MPAASCYRWGVGISPFPVDVYLDWVTRLRNEISQAPIIEGRQMEIGGLLLGKTHGDVVEIHDFQLVPSEHRRGASFNLSTHDRVGLQRDISKINKPDALQVVGYFRTHTRPGLYLDEHDDMLARDYFAKPSQVFLLIRPDTPPQAGFFFWEEGEINRKQTYLPFPFEPSLLADQEVSIQPNAVSAPLPQKKTSSRSALLLVPFAAGALAAVVIPWWNNRVPEKVTSAATETKASAQSVPFFRESPEEVLAVTEPRTDIRPPVRRPFRPVLRPKHEVALAVKTGMALEPVSESAVSRTFHRVPLLSQLQRHRKGGGDFVPAKPIHDPKPILPSSIARELTGPTPVDVKLTVAKNGRVSEIELLSKHSDAQLRNIVLGTATRWNFEPATIKGKPVESQVVAHFRFEPR